MAKITWYGHASFRLEYAGKTIWIDPWKNGNPVWPQGVEVSPADVYLITHGHFDHLDAELPVWANRDEAVVFTPPAVQMYLYEKINNLEDGNTGGTVACGDIRVTWTEGRHAAHIHAATPWDFPHESTGYLLRAPSEPTIYIAGDTGILPGMELLGKMYQPQVAILPIGDRFTMGPFEAAWATRLLGVSKVIPGHYNTFDALTGTLSQFELELKNDQVKVLALEIGTSAAL